MRDKTSTKSKLTATEFAQLPETLIPTELIHGELIEISAPKNRHQDIVLNIAVFLRDYGLGIYEKGDEFISVALNHKKILADDLLV